MKSLFFAVLLLSAGSVSASGFVADPYRSTGVVWKKYPFMGKDFWLLLNPAWLTLKGLKEEPFVRQSGSSHVQTAVKWKNFSTMRTIAIREILLTDSSGNPVQGRIIPDVSCEKLFFQTPEFVCDGRKETAGILSAPLTDIKRRYTSFHASLRVAAKKGFTRLEILHGIADGGKIRNAKIAAPDTGHVRKNNGSIEITFPKQLTEVALLLESEIPVCSITRLRFYPHEKERLKKYPFYVEPPFRFALGSLLGLREENIDRASFDKIRKEYPDSFIGFRLAEWDSNFLQTLMRPSSDRFKDLVPFLNIPCSREGLIRNFHTFWKMHSALFGSNIYGLSGQVNFMHMGCDFGGKIAGVELTQEHKEHPHRNTLMYTRGASRQFEVPMLVYTAYYALNYAPDSRIRRKNSVFGLDYGMPPSLGLRNFYLSYYMGNNFLDFESQVYGQVVRNSKGTYELTGNGKAIKEIFEWSSRPEGRRGECYTPFLMLADRKHGNDMWVRLMDYWGSWYSLFPAGDPQYMTEYFMQSVSPRYDVRSFEDPVSSGNLRNSPLGDIFDLYVANPLIRKSVSLKQLEKYAAVFLIDHLDLTGELVHTLKQYVARGGTLVLSTGQAAFFTADKKFLPAGISAGTTVRDNLRIHRLTPGKQSRVMMKTSDGLPLVVCHSYGNGNVILSASPFWRTMTNRLRAPEQLLTMLKDLQKEVLPLQVRGDCQFLFNIMPDHTWKVILINNRGIVKRPWESHETYHKKYTSQVTLTLPRGVTVRELRKNARMVKTVKSKTVDCTFTLEPAEILVVDCIGLKKFPQKQFSNQFRVQRTALPANVPANTDSAAQYRKRHLPASVAKRPATPALVGRWRASDHYKDSSGNGNDMKLFAAEIKENRLVLRKDKSHGQIQIKAPYPLDSGTWEIWLKPLPAKEFPLRNGKRRSGVLHTKQMMIEYVDGYWVLVLFDRNVRFLCKGSRAVPEWTHLTLTFADGFCRFFINGKEVIPAEGPLKYTANPGKNTFYNNIKLSVGCLAPHVSEIYSFRGDIGDVTFHGRALTAGEILQRYRTTFPGRM